MDTLKVCGRGMDSADSLTTEKDITCSKNRPIKFIFIFYLTYNFFVLNFDRAAVTLCG